MPLLLRIGLVNGGTVLRLQMATSTVTCVQLYLIATLQAEENLGMAMIFTLVTAVQEKLDEIVDLIKNRCEEEKRRKDAEAEEAEKVKR